MHIHKLTILFPSLPSIFPDSHYLLTQVAPKCEELLLRCVWKDRVHEPCSTMFKLHKTYEGYCCSFNYFGIKEEDRE